MSVFYIFDYFNNSVNDDQAIKQCMKEISAIFSI